MQDFTHLVRNLMAKPNQITYCRHKSGWLAFLTKNYSLENKYFQIVQVIVLICSCKSRVVLWQMLWLSTNQFKPRSMELYFQLLKENYYHSMTSAQLFLSVLHIPTPIYDAPPIPTAVSIFHHNIQHPLFQMCINFSVVCRLRRRPPSQHQNINDRRRMTNSIIIAVTCIFFFSWLPFNILNISMIS